MKHPSSNRLNITIWLSELSFTFLQTEVIENTNQIFFCLCLFLNDFLETKSRVRLKIVIYSDTIRGNGYGRCGMLITVLDSTGAEHGSSILVSLY